MTRVLLMAFPLALLLGACGNDAAEPAAPSEPAAPASAEPVPARMEDDVQVAEITVDGALYRPAAVLLQPGIPARLLFSRTDAPTCGDTLMAPQLGIGRRAIPVGEQTAVEFTPAEVGTYTFTCGMDMMSGRIVVQS